MHDVSVLEREDLALFINAACTCSGQSEFYGDGAAQRVSLSFLHDYVFGNYRRLYALCLAGGVNHFNTAAILHRLLSAGAPADPEQRNEEGRLIAGVLKKLPPQRVYRLFSRLRRAGVNNRRTRATVKRWLQHRDMAFDAVKYRGALRSIARHTHPKLPTETHAFLFDGPHSRSSWETPLYATFRLARYDQRALYQLPFTVAEGLAVAKGIDRATFLERARSQMTQGERARLQRHSAALGVDTDASLASLPPTRIAVMALNRPVSEREPLRTPLDAAAQRVAHHGLQLPGRVHAVLDCSFSSRSGNQKRNHALAVTLAISRVLAAGSKHYQAHWTRPTSDDLSVVPRGQTGLARPLLLALRGQPDLIVVVSDGFENDPPGATAEVVRLCSGWAPPIVHLNPVFDASSFMPRTLGPSVPTVGIRHAGELATKLGFARFVSGSSGIEALQGWLLQRARPWLEAP